MKHFKRHQLTGLLLCAFLPLVSHGKVPLDQAKRLNDELTPFGAIRAGDSALGIPAWTGGLHAAPAGYAGPGSFEIDPFAQQKPMLVIDAGNQGEYVQHLSEGVRALLASYPKSFRLPIYPSERTFAAPQEIYDNTARNALTAELNKDGNGFAHAYGGIPFPIPQSGLEAVWNHIGRWQGRYFQESSTTALVRANGGYSTLREENQLLSNYYAPGKDAKSLDNILFHYINRILPPSRGAGEIVLVHETLDQVAMPRMAWNYLPGQRRVRRAPTVAYDNPVDGYLSDDADMFNGAPNRFDWQLLGRQALYVPYNNYLLGQPGTPHETILHKGHINPDLARWEMHRVWLVEATLKTGERHVYAKRRFYLDEDSWSILMAENYDSR
ncbi:MAG: outer membrane lipoprotein-sorting protein, partial [Pseudomonas sp. PGPPP3]